ncbi:hypothetical protein BT69DRAFT_1285881 [Atractiella rhizophila]|nr:hypothetical protein BT69DRAFT_1285881 [Atractiella rhizophila]
MDDVRSMPEDAETQPITMEEDLHWDAITRNSADSVEIVEDWSTLPKKTNNQAPDGETRKIVSRTTVAQTDYLTYNIPSIPLIPHALDGADLPTPPSPLPQRPTLVVPGLMDCSEMSEGSSLPSPSPPTMPSLAPSSRIEVTKTIRPGSILRQLEMRNEPKQMTSVTSPASFLLAAPLSMIPLQIPVPKSISKSTTGNATNSKSLTHPPIMPATAQDSRNKGQTAFIRHRERQWQTDNPDLPLPLIVTFKAEYKLLSSKEKSNWNKLANQQQTPSTTSTFAPLMTAFPKPHSNPTPFQRPEA